MKKLFVLLLAVLMVLTLAGCGSKKIEVEPIPSDTLYVEKVETLPEDFILGMDSSQVPALEAAGVKYYDFEGNETDVFETLAKSGRVSNIVATIGGLLNVKPIIYLNDACKFQTRQKVFGRRNATT